MKIWTDYPILELGDAPGKPAPVREAKPLSYDGDKYVRCRVDAVEIEIKSGYLYMEEGRFGEVPPINRRILSQIKQKSR
jgi:hypothetical protein